MNRKPRTLRTTRVVPYSKNPDIVKFRHRSSDSKYRQNVQFLYGLLKKNIPKSTTKNNLLNAVSNDIKEFQEDIGSLVGSQVMMKYNDKFLEIIEMEGDVWKKQKNLASWWDEMQDVLVDIMRDLMSTSTSLSDVSK